MNYDAQNHELKIYGIKVCLNMRKNCLV